MKITDLLLRQCAPTARNIWLNTLPETETVPEHTFSQEFELVMSELVQEQKQPAPQELSRQDPWAEEAVRYKLDGTIQFDKLK